LTGTLAKTVQGLVTVVVLVLSVFVLIRLLPGDPARAVAGELASAQDVERVRQEMGLDQPLQVQLARYLQRLANGDMGTSVRTFQPVGSVIMERVGRTLVLSASAMTLALLLAILLAVLAARQPGSILDSSINVVAVLSYGTPVFWVALVAIDLFAVRLHWLPSGGQTTIQHLILPMSVLAFFLMGPLAQLLRTSLSEVMSKDFIVMARAKGLNEWRVLLVHALRNAMLPTLAYLGTQAGLLFAGAAITESIFGWNGLGSLVVSSALSRDYAMLQGLLLVIGVGFVFINIGIELLYGVVDPRMRLRA
jgi:ABC-type dipeptide/oligopeptide/nickel transport system permease component